MAESKLRNLSVEFSVKIIKLCESIKGHYSLTNQLERSGTSIGANIREAFYRRGKNDFIAKLQIALKECSESGYYDDESILENCIELKKILISSINTIACSAR